MEDDERWKMPKKNATFLLTFYFNFIFLFYFIILLTFFSLYLDRTAKKDWQDKWGDKTRNDMQQRATVWNQISAAIGDQGTQLLDQL